MSNTQAIFSGNAKGKLRFLTGQFLFKKTKVPFPFSSMHLHLLSLYNITKTR